MTRTYRFTTGAALGVVALSALGATTAAADDWQNPTPSATAAPGPGNPQATVDASGWGVSDHGAAVITPPARPQPARVAAPVPAQAAPPAHRAPVVTRAIPRPQTGTQGRGFAHVVIYRDRGVRTVRQGESTWTVRRGQTLELIASRTHRTLVSIVRRNGIVDADWIAAGATLVIPGRG
jgi:nucleoid-associated protein YgaU